MTFHISFITRILPLVPTWKILPFFQMRVKLCPEQPVVYFVLILTNCVHFGVLLEIQRHPVIGVLSRRLEPVDQKLPASIAVFPQPSFLVIIISVATCILPLNIDVLPLNIDASQQGLQLLVGYRDLFSFLA